MTKTTTSSLRGLAALALVPIALAGCSSQGGTAGATSGTTSSSTAPQKLYDLCEKSGDIDKAAFFAAKNDSPDKTAHIEGSIDISGAGAGGATSTSSGTSASGATTSASGTSTSASGGNGMPLSGDVDGRDPNNPKVRLSLGGSLAGGQMDMILVDKSIYLNMGALTGNKYAQISADQLAKQSGVDLNQMTNPNQQLDKAKDAVTKVTCVGREDVSGTQTAHLRVTIDTAKAAALATASSTGSSSGSGTATTGATSAGSAGSTTSGSGGAGAGTATTAPKAGSSLPATTDTDLWIDASNRPLKVASGAGQQTVTMTYSKWGEPVTIQAPPTASVTQLPGMAGGTANSGSVTSTTSPATRS